MPLDLPSRSPFTHPPKNVWHFPRSRHVRLWLICHVVTDYKILGFMQIRHEVRLRHLITKKLMGSHTTYFYSEQYHNVRSTSRLGVFCYTRHPYTDLIDGGSSLSTAKYGGQKGRVGAFVVPPRLLGGREEWGSIGEMVGVGGQLVDTMYVSVSSRKSLRDHDDD